MIAGLVALVLAASAGPARADGPLVGPTDPDPASVHHVSPPPAPSDHPAVPIVEIHGQVAAPFERSTICPPGADCVLGIGVGLGAQLEWRLPDRVGIFGAYDFWILDSAGVYEIGAAHALRGGVRYTFDDTALLHPFVDGSIGVLTFGETGLVATVGGLVAAGGGAELEISGSVSIVGAAELWLFSTAPFQTRDGALRAAGFGVTAVVQVTIGLAVALGPVTAPP